MPPPGHEPFLRAICENPEDDTARLVYADWLDENGDPDRAEFIRLQVVTASRQYDRMDQRFLRAGRLEERKRSTWLAELPMLQGVKWSRGFHRGFVCNVETDGVKWLVQQREAIFTAAPIDNLTLHGATHAMLAKLFTIPEVDRLTGLVLRACRVGEDHWHPLTRCPRLGHLRGLTINRSTSVLSGGQALTDNEAVAFVESRCLPRLEAIGGNGWVSKKAMDLLLTRFRVVGIYRNW